MTPMPTVTLANIFEKQEQFIEALALYQLISTNNDDSLYSEKISELKQLIFSSNHNDYHKFLVTLFNKTERNEFQILPHEDFENYIATIKQFKDIKKSIKAENSIIKEEKPSLVTDVLYKLEKLDPIELDIRATKKFNKKINSLTIAEIEELL